MATVTFTSTNYSAGTCVFTPSDANHSETNLGSITFPFTFNPLAYSLPAEIIEGAFEFTVGGCVFTKQVARSATAATAATTLATLGTIPGTLATFGTNATAATTQASSGSGSGSGGGSGETLATAATTLATVPPATIATEATTLATAAPARYNVIDDTTEDNAAKVDSTFAFRIETSGVREGTRGTFTFIEGSPEGGNTERAGGPEGEPYEGEPGTFTIDANGIGSIFIKVRKDSGNVQIQLDRLDEDGNGTRELVSDRIKLVTDGEEPGPVTAATTLATEATNATEAPTSATAATTLATNATEAPTNATAATTLATSATAAPTAETNATNATMAPIVTEATEATEATTINEATQATEATVTPTEATNATVAPTSATAATTLATNATTQATEGTEATQATVTPTEGTNATIKPTTPTEGTEATAAPTLATEATNATEAPTSATAATTLATDATTLATNETAATTQASSGSGSGDGDGDPTNPTVATTQATLATNATIPEPEGNNYVFRSCAFNGNPGNGRTIVFEAKAWEEAIGELPAFDSTVLNKEEGQCYSYVGTSQDPATDDLRDYEHRGCRCDGGLEGEE